MIFSSFQVTLVTPHLPNQAPQIQPEHSSLPFPMGSCSGSDGKSPGGGIHLIDFACPFWLFRLAFLLKFWFALWMPLHGLSSE